MMDRLITFGCSYTYGFGLPDCYVNDFDPGPFASQHSWAAILAKKLNRRLVNLSHSGSSNLEILNSVLNYNFLPDDKVIVQWSFTDRDTIFHPTKGNIQIGPWESYEHFKEWLKIHSAYDLTVKSWLYMHHAQQHLKLLNVDFSFLNIIELNQKPRWASNIEFLKTNFKDFQDAYPKAKDNVHPGIECHVSVAEEIYKEINT